MLAAYLVHDQKMDPMDAIEEIRHRRPYSVETYQQEDVVIDYSEHLKKQSPKDSDR